MGIADKLIICHATLGGLALLAGLIAIIAKKGLKLHRVSGKIFFFSMLSSAFVALLVSILPSHLNPFLFSIGIFSSYFIVTGYLALRFKKEIINLKIDKVLAGLMFLTGVFMVFFPIIYAGEFNIILGVFGLFSMGMAVLDLMSYRSPENLRKNWVKAHLGKMLGGYISAVTAFVVVNQLLPGIYAWFVPGVVGGFYIANWNRKISAN